MELVSHLDLSDLPHSDYAAELKRVCPDQPFAPKLEAQYLRTQLRHNRILIRVVCLLTLVLLLLYGTELATSNAWSRVAVSHFGLTLAASVAVAWLAWGPYFERWYLPWAQSLVPVRNLIVTLHIVQAAASGRQEVLMLLSAMLISPFFFLGFGLRVAILCGVSSTAAFVLAALHFELAPSMIARACALMLLGVATCAIGARQLQRRARMSFLEGQLIAELAQQDSLTGTKNRRVFDKHLALLWNRAWRERRRIAVLLIDIDHFKAYNDRYGHLAGDQALRQVAQTVHGLIERPLDLAARYGGEEFGAILFDVDANEARAAAERICRAVSLLSIGHLASRTSSTLTISVGVAVIEPSGERSPRGALQLADQALYNAKLNGRNRVELLGAVEHELLQTGVFSIIGSDSSQSAA